eukprot:11632417-Heterocapsa_arctica.AAC.1
MIGWVGDELTAVQPHLYADADFAGCVETQRSTCGYHFAIRGPKHVLSFSRSKQTSGLRIAFYA